MKISIDDAGCELTDLSHMRTKDFPSRLFRQPLWDGHNGHEDSSGYDARDDEHIASELT